MLMKYLGLPIGVLAAIVTYGTQGLLVRAAEGAQPDRSCAPEGNIRFICGRSTAEDMVAIPGTDWIIASAYIGAVGLRLISVREEKDVAVLFPAPGARKKQDMATYGACPGPLSAEGEAMFVAHGIALKKVTDRSFTLYVVRSEEHTSELQSR